MAILTISRQLGSGGNEIGRAVADSLGYAYVDKERILEDISAAGHNWRQWAAEMDEQSPNVWERYDWSFRGLAALIQCLILQYASEDRVVIVGRGGNFVLEGIAHALRIHVAAPLEARMARVGEREGVDAECARWLVEKSDRERAGFITSIYGKPWDAPTEYDLMVNTGHKPIEEITATIVTLLEEREQLHTEEAGGLLRMRSAAARVKAGLFTDRSFFIPTLDVFYDGKQIVLRGVIHNPREHRRVEEAAKKLAGDAPLRCELHYRG